MPAYVASGAADVAATLLPPVRLGTSLPITATLTNIGNAPTLNLRVTLRVEIPSALTMVGVTCSTPTGYTFVSTTYASDTVVLHTFKADAQVAANGAGTFAPTVTVANTGSLTPSGNAQVVPAVDAPGTATASTRQNFS